jgi:MEMO1 family protein
MKTMNDYPKLRYGIEGFPVEHGGRQLIMLRDRLSITEESLLVSPQLARLMGEMDGSNSLRDLQASYMRLTGQLLYTDELEQILNKLDENLYLENDRFKQFMAQEAAKFREDPIRRMQLAGKSYPAEPDVLRRQFDQYFSVESGGPGTPRHGGTDRILCGLVAPHIDIEAGGSCFAHAYHALCEAVAPQTWVILGTGHEWVENAFALCPKDFETPLGNLLCDREYCSELERRAPFDLRASEYNHRKEHSIEFQAAFLARFQPRARIVPLLCSFHLEEWETRQRQVDAFARLLVEIAEAGERTVGFLASVDLAHIGPRYGDRFTPQADTIAEHRAADRELLECLKRCDSSSFLGRLEREGNKRRICGLAPLYVLCKILEGRATGTLLNHSHAVVDQQGSFVTFASMAFYEEKSLG